MRPKMLDRGAKGGVHDGLNNDQPRCARGPVQAARPREALANVGTFASHASQGGPLSLLRSRGQPDRQRASPASSNPPVSAALVLPPSYLVSACSSWLQTEAANDSELSSHECSLIRALSSISKTLRVNHRGTRKACMVLESKPTAIPAPRPLGSVTPLAGENCHMRLDKNARHPPMCVRRRTSVAA